MLPSHPNLHVLVTESNKSITVKALWEDTDKPWLLVFCDNCKNLRREHTLNCKFLEGRKREMAYYVHGTSDAVILMSKPNSLNRLGVWFRLKTHPVHCGKGKINKA